MHETAPSSLRALLGEAIQLGATKQAEWLRREGLLAITGLRLQVCFWRVSIRIGRGKNRFRVVFTGRYAAL